MSIIDKLGSSFSDFISAIKTPQKSSKVDAISGASEFAPVQTAKTAAPRRGMSEDKFVDASIMNESNEKLDINALQGQKVEFVSKKTTKETELSAVNSGENEKISAKKSAMDESYEKYQTAMAEDSPEVQALKTKQDELKTQLDENSLNISNKESDISNKENEISTQGGVIANFKSELDTLQSQLSSIPANSDEEGSEESNAKLDKQRAEITKLIDLKKKEISLAEAKYSRLEEEKDAMKLELTGLKETKTTLAEEEKSIQTEIQGKASDATKQAQEAYNKARTEFETAKKEAASALQGEISNLNTQIQEIDAKITEAKNQEYKNGDYKVTGKDVTDLATQYEGLTNDEMKAVIQSEGGRFDDGAWCADFVTHMMNQAYGKDSTPNDFSNDCKMFCAVRYVKAWGDENGLTTLDTSDVKAGDAIIVNTKSGGLHIGMVVSFNEDGTINTIEGNTLDDYGNYDDNNPGQVNRRLRTADEVNTYVKFH